MQLSALQIVLLVLVAAEINVDRRGLSLTHARPVIVGFLCGLILGDMNSGLYIDDRSSCWYAGRTDGRFIQDLQLFHCPEIPEICQ